MVLLPTPVIKSLGKRLVSFMRSDLGLVFRSSRPVGLAICLAVPLCKLAFPWTAPITTLAASLVSWATSIFLSNISKSSLSFKETLRTASLSMERMNLVLKASSSIGSLIDWKSCWQAPDLLLCAFFQIFQCKTCTLPLLQITLGRTPIPWFSEFHPFSKH